MKRYCFLKYEKNIYNILLGATIMALLLWAQPARAVINAQKWEVVEISLTSDTSYNNAYTDVEVTATFTGPTQTKEVKAFWDGQENGKDTFKVRFTPTEEGIWNYSIFS
jgi:hypothetical protein